MLRNPNVKINRTRKYEITGTRWTLLLALMVVVGICVLPTLRAGAANPAAGTLAPTDTQVSWVGTATGTATGAGSESACVEGQNCDTYTLTLSGNPSDWTGKRLTVRINWLNAAYDYDLYVHKTSNTGPLVGKSAGATPPETVTFDPSDPNVGTGVFTVHVTYFTVPPPIVEQYQGTATVTAAPPADPPPTPAVQGSGLAPRFQNFNPPQSMLATGKGANAGEPSIGVNWKTNKAMFQSNLTTFRVTFDDSCPTSPVATWEDKTAPNALTSLDPISFTDHGYNNQTPTVGRTFVSQLTGVDSLSAYTDDDGQTYTPSQGGGIPSGVDHQTFGAGPFHVPLTGGTPDYPNAVYYCSQDIAAVFCARSDDGGVTFGAGVPVYNSTQCGGLHGHVKVGPDGTVYLPNKSCGGKQAVVVSEDNGVTWAVRKVPGTVPGGTDPTVAIGRGDETSSGRVYLAISNTNQRAVVAVSDDRGVTWPKVIDVGASLGLNGIAFPEMVAGDDGRAAAAFLGSTTVGSPGDRAYPGLWHLYVMTTYDGGLTWLTSDATPNDPVQRNGIHLGGGSPAHRNMLDFNGIDIDKQGRILVGYADGCAGPGCVQGNPNTTGNSYTAVASIARQSGGRRLFAGTTPAEPTLPGAPFLTVGRDGSVAHLTWSESDDGGTPVTSYTVLRGTTPGGTTLLANLGAVNSYDDTTANPSVTYYYKVTATNAVGASCGTNETLSRFIGDSQCAGLREVQDPTGDQSGAPANADLDVQEVRVADIVEGGVNKVVFKLKLANLSTLPPDRQWRIIWNYPIKAANIPAANFTGTYYVGMNTDNASATSFEYGTVTTVEAVPANTSTPTRVGSADSGSVNQQSGIITIVLSADKIGSPQAGDVVGALIGRTFAGNGNQTVLASSSVDTTSRTAQDPFTGVSYRLVGNLPCPALLNYALSLNGGTAIGSTTANASRWPAASTINGDRTGNQWGNGTGGWNDGTRGVFPDSLEVTFNGAKTISEINVFTLQNNWTTAGEPNLTTPATGEGILDFDVQYWNGSAWVTVPGGSVTSNDKAWRQFMFTAVTTTKIRVVVNNSRNNYSRIVELEAVGASGQ